MSDIILDREDWINIKSGLQEIVVIEQLPNIHIHTCDKCNIIVNNKLVGKALLYNDACYDFEHHQYYYVNRDDVRVTSMVDEKIRRQYFKIRHNNLIRANKIPAVYSFRDLEVIE